MCGYAEETDMVKYILAAREVIQPMVIASVQRSGSSSRMVRTSRQCFIFLSPAVSGPGYRVPDEAGLSTEGQAAAILVGEEQTC